MIMITNLFSIFDPSTRYNLSLNWLTLIILLIIIPLKYWILPNNFIIINNIIINKLFNEFKIIINKKNNINFNLLLISLFIFIIINNFIGLFPYIFTRTRHLSINLRIALPLWIGIIIYGWINKINHIFTHLVPQGTPNILIPFIVLIESISNIIRPITLTVRLTANIIAGHLLLTILGNIGPNLNTFIIPILFITQSILLILESAVTIIQAYVFSVLLTLYIREI